MRLFTLAGVGILVVAAAAPAAPGTGQQRPERRTSGRNGQGLDASPQEFRRLIELQDYRRRAEEQAKQQQRREEELRRARQNWTNSPINQAMQEQQQRKFWEHLAYGSRGLVRLTVFLVGAIVVVFGGLGRMLRALFGGGGGDG